MDYLFILCLAASARVSFRLSLKYHNTLHSLSLFLAPQSVLNISLHSTPNSEFSKVSSVQKIRKLLNFRKASHLAKNSRMKIKGNGNFQEFCFQKFGYTSRISPRSSSKLCKFVMFYSALVLLDAIIVSWASHAKMTRTRIRKWN